MSVCDKFTIEIYGFMHSLSTFLACAAYNTIMRRSKTGRIEDDGRLENKS